MDQISLSFFQIWISWLPLRASVAGFLIAIVHSISPKPVWPFVWMSRTVPHPVQNLQYFCCSRQYTCVTKLYSCINNQHYQDVQRSLLNIFSEIVGFRRGWTKFFRPLGYSTVLRGLKATFREYLSVPSSKIKMSWTSWPMKIRPIGIPETSVSNHLMLRKNTEYGRIQIFVSLPFLLLSGNTCEWNIQFESNLI